MAFGPARCVGCSTRYPVHDGLVDFAGEQPAKGAMQRLMEHPFLARSWDGSVRPALDWTLTLGRLDLESEWTLLSTLLGSPRGPVVDLGCGAGLLLRKLSRSLSVPVIGVDVSRPMLEEAVAMLREHAAAADFVRASVPPLPFNDASLGGVVAVGLVQLLESIDELLFEMHRVLQPGGRVVGTSYEAPAALRPLHRVAGLHPHGEEALRTAAKAAGLVHFERVKVGPVLAWKAERP